MHDPLKSDGLKSLVNTIFKVLDSVYLVIDGLDEIDRSEREKFFRLILPLVNLGTSRVDGTTECRIKLFISSRGEDDIAKSLNSIGRIWRKSYEITGDDNQRDIAFYVSLRVRELQGTFGLDDLRREEVFKEVCSRAGGAYNCCHISN